MGLSDQQLDGMVASSGRIVRELRRLQSDGWIECAVRQILDILKNEDPHASLNGFVLFTEIIKEHRDGNANTTQEIP